MTINISRFYLLQQLRVDRSQLKHSKCFRYSVDSGEDESCTCALSQITFTSTIKKTPEIPKILLLVFGRCAPHCLQWWAGLFIHKTINLNSNWVFKRLLLFFLLLISLKYLPNAINLLIQWSQLFIPYLLTNVDCNAFLGYDLRQVNNYISKLLENVGELTYTEPDDSEKNLFEITGVRSVLGEHLLFKQVYKPMSNIKRSVSES